VKTCETKDAKPTAVNTGWLAREGDTYYTTCKHNQANALAQLYTQ